MNRLARVAALVGMLGIIGAVTAPGVPAKVLEKPSDCPLVPTAEAQDAIGLDLQVSSPPVTTGTNASRLTVTCTWLVQEPHLTSDLTVRLATGPKEAARYAKARTRARNAIAVSGLGQRAFWTQTGGRLVALVDANTLVTIVHPDPTASGGQGYRAASEAIAKLVIARL
jgi:hypothetical protein